MPLERVRSTVALRRFLRGQIAWSRLEGVVRDVMDRYDLRGAHVEFLDANNWLSTPLVIDDRLFVKVISRQHSLVHALLTTGRNLGAFSAGTEGFFEHFGDPLEMAEHELRAARRMREAGLNVPEPLEAFESDGLGVLVLEYLPAFRTLDELDPLAVDSYAVDIFEHLDAMHETGLAHGDLRSENVLVSEGELYFIDATSVNENGMADASAYDLACALAVLTPLIGPRETIQAALEVFDVDALLAAQEFIDFVNIRPDHDFDAVAVKGEIEKAASNG
jgi:serine/threonine protein kinase